MSIHHFYHRNYGNNMSYECISCFYQDVGKLMNILHDY